MKKAYLILSIIMVLAINVASAQGWFDPVAYKGAFPESGHARNAAANFTGYNPDPSFTDANWAKKVSDGGWVEWDPQNATYGAPTSTKSGDISADVTWSGVIEISGTIHVLSGATLTIEAGTVIRGSTSNTGVLIISPGGKINAIGTSSNPIVFTSGNPSGQRKAGDWGGLLLIGKSIINSGGVPGGGGTRPYEALPTDPLAVYGGNNEFDNSGTLRFVRVEFAGYNFLPDQEINGITFAACGSQTKADYLQVSFSRDDSFEWFGGTSNHKYLISYASVDDEIDMDEGYRGKVQHVLCVRKPDVFETSAGGTSNSFEHDNNTNGNTPAAVNTTTQDPIPATAPIISNATIYGPTQNGNTLISGNKFGRALEIRTNAASSIFNSIVLGFPTLFQTGNPAATFLPSVQGKLSTGINSISNNYFASNGGIITTGATPTSVIILGVAGLTTTDGVALTWLTNTSGNGGLGNFAEKSASAVGNILFSNISNNNFSSNDYTLQAGSPAATTASFSDPIIAKYTSAAIPTIAFPSILPTFNIVAGNSTSTQVTVNFANVTSTGFTLSAPANFTLSSTTFNVTTTTGSFTFTVSYSRSTEGADAGTITITNSQLSAASIAVSGTAVAPAKPILNTDRSAINYWTAGVKGFKVDGTLLTQDVVISSNNGEFQVSTSSSTGWAGSVSLTPVNGSVSAWVYVNYLTANGAISSGMVSVTTGGTAAISKLVTLSANTSPKVTLSVSDLPNNQTAISPLTQFGANNVAGWYAYAYPVTVTATNIPEAGLLVKPNSIFQISTVPGSAGITDAGSAGFSNSLITLSGLGSSFTTVLYVRTNQSAAVGFSNKTPGLEFFVGTVTSVSTRIASVNIGGTTVATPTTTGIVVNYRNGLSFTSLNGEPSEVQQVNFYAQHTTLTMAGLNVVANSLFEISKDGTTWSAFADLTTPGLSYAFDNSSGIVASVSGTVYVRFNPKNANSTIPGNSFSDNLVAVSGDLVFNFIGTSIANSNSATNVDLALRAAYFPDITIDPLTLPLLNAIAGLPSSSAPVHVTGNRVVSAVKFNAPSGFELSSDAAFTTPVSIVSLPANSVTGVFDATFYVRYNATSTTPGAGFISIDNPNAPSQSIAVSGASIAAPAPVLSMFASATSITLTGAEMSSVTVSGSQLSTGITVTAPTGFQVSTSNTSGFGNSVTLTQGTIIGAVGTTTFGSVASTVVYIKPSSTTTGASGDLTAASAGFTTAIPQSIALTYTVITGIDDELPASSVVVYPNPSNGNVTIAYNGLTEGTVMIYDYTGTTSHIANFAAGASKSEVSGLASGFYLVRITTKSGTKTLKLVVQ